MSKNKSKSKTQLSPRPTSYKKNITPEDVIEIINAMKNRPLIWVPNPRKNQMNDQKTYNTGDKKQAWNEVLNELTNKTITMEKLKIKWTECRNKYFKVKSSGAKALKDWPLGSRLKFLDQLDENPGKQSTTPKSTKKKQKSKPVDDSDYYNDENSEPEDPLDLSKENAVHSTPRSVGRRSQKKLTRSTGKTSPAKRNSVHGTPKATPSARKRLHMDEKSVSSVKKATRSVGKTSIAEGKSVRSTPKPTPIKKGSKAEEKSFHSPKKSNRKIGNTSLVEENSADSTSKSIRSNGVTSTEVQNGDLQSKEASDVNRHPNSTLCEYLLAELHSLTEDKSRHLRRLLLQTVYDFVDYPDS